MGSASPCRPTSVAAATRCVSSRSWPATSGVVFPVRLVKGAYWDTEIKRAQEQGSRSYPVFTRKSHHDVSYLACARQALAAGDKIYPQFATHNAHTLASVLHFAGARRDYEFQRLHGMGEELYAEIIDPEKHDRPCRVYAPVGSHEDLLPYLVRRLLENGSNTSFVNRSSMSRSPLKTSLPTRSSVAASHDLLPHPQDSAPAELFQPERGNSHGVNLADRNVSRRLLADHGRLQCQAAVRRNRSSAARRCRVPRSRRSIRRIPPKSSVFAIWRRRNTSMRR